MKPIRLKFSGLQSYREEQDIDFEELGARGIFGVFGPTGGGKSTILDAITLALFGKVERAKNGTRGIINQSEKKAQVSFEFALGTSCFLVERLYERDKHDMESVSNKVARLVDITAGHSVLADRKTDVDVKVVELLGMSFEDFSRAVVLPQGKFDQFLKLTGGDRAKMLEHIFFLERYGEGLTKKVTELEKHLEHKLDVTSNLIAQLGEASGEKIQEVEGQLAQQRILVQEKEAVKRNCQNIYKQLEGLEVIHREHSVLIQQKETLEAQRPELERDKVRLEKAMQAENLRSLLEQLQELEKHEAADLLNLKGAEGRAKAVRGKCEAAQTRLDAAVKNESELNRLREELPKIALALDLAQRCRQTQTEIARLLKEKEDRTTLLDKHRAAGQTKSDSLKKVTGKIAELKAEQKSLSAVTDCRIELEKALAALTAFLTAKEQQKEALEVLKNRNTLLDMEKKKLLQLLAVNLSEVSSSQKDITVEEGLKLAAGLIDRAVKEKSAAEEQLANINEAAMAAQLAGKLAVGQACPVCGSTTHPRPAGMGADDGDGSTVQKARDSLTRVGQRLDQLRNWESELKVLARTVASLTDEITSLYKKRAEEKTKCRKEAEELLLHQVSLLASRGKDFAQSPLTDLRVESGQLDTVIKAVNSFKEVYEAAQVRSGIVATALSEQDAAEKGLTTEVNDLRTQYREVLQQLQNTEENLKTLRDSENDIRKNIDLITGGLPPHEYASRVNTEIEKIQSELNAARLEWDSVQKEVQESERELTALKVAWEKSRQHLEMVRQQLEKDLSKQSFDSLEVLKASLMEPDQREEIKKHIDHFEEKLVHLSTRIEELGQKLKEKSFSREDLVTAKAALEAAEREHEEAVRIEGAVSRELEETRQKHAEWLRLSEERVSLKRKKDLTTKLSALLKGRKFIQFLAEEHLADMTAEASLRLASLTGQRYALELDEGGSFVMRDDYSGGLRRPVSTLSGGETFLTSLSMALALSSKIQLKGKYPLGFFFLDEGFGTLDPEKLEVVMNTLERLHDGHRTVGVITHVQDLRARMPRYLEVTPAAQDGSGSRVMLKRN